MISGLAIQYRKPCELGGTGRGWPRPAPTHRPRRPDWARSRSSGVLVHRQWKSETASPVMPPVLTSLFPTWSLIGGDRDVPLSGLAAALCCPPPAGRDVSKAGRNLTRSHGLPAFKASGSDTSARLEHSHANARTSSPNPRPPWDANPAATDLRVRLHWGDGLDGASRRGWYHADRDRPGAVGVARI